MHFVFGRREEGKGEVISQGIRGGEGDIVATATHANGTMRSLMRNLGSTPRLLCLCVPLQGIFGGGHILQCIHAYVRIISCPQANVHALRVHVDVPA